MFGAANTSLTHVYMIWRSSGRQLPFRLGVGGAAASSDDQVEVFFTIDTYIDEHILGGTPRVFLFIYIYIHGASLCTRYGEREREK